METPNPGPAFLTETEVARQLRISKSTLQKQRHFGTDGPPFVRFGRSIRYDAAGVRAWAEARAAGGRP